MLPTDYITKTGQIMNIDGIDFQFINAPESEAPSEFMFYIPKFKAFCTSEEAVRNFGKFGLIVVDPHHSQLVHSSWSKGQRWFALVQVLARNVGHVPRHGGSVCFSPLANMG